MPSSVLSLPFEIVSIIVAFLSRKDQLTFSLVSSNARRHVLAPIFRDFTLGKHGQEINDHLKGAGQEIRDVIRRVTIKGRLYSSNHEADKIFRLLEELPNLSDIDLVEYHASVRLQDLALLVQVAQYKSLRHLSFTVECGSVASGLPVTGPKCLSSLCVNWRVHDEPSNQGISLAHLYALIRPSLTSLTRLEVTDFDPFWKPTDLQHFDFRRWPVCLSVRDFKYRTLSRDTKLLGLSETFPNLTHLGMIFDGYNWNDWAVWTDECLNSLSSFPHLTHLNLCLDFELAAQDSLRPNSDFAWYRRCFLRRYSASEAIAKVSPGLRRCEWLQLCIDHSGNDQSYPFVILEEAGKRVVRPVLLWWMDEGFGHDLGGPLPENMVIEERWWVRTGLPSDRPL